MNKFNFYIIFTVLIIHILNTINCEKIENTVQNNDINPPVSYDTLPSLIAARLDVNDFHVVIDSIAKISEGEYWGESVPPYGWPLISVIYSCGLWLGTYDNYGNVNASLMWSDKYPGVSNFTNKFNNRKIGIYKLLASDPPDSNVYWPIEYGAPTDENEEPLIFGDGMCWSAFQSDTTVFHTVFSKPIKSIIVSQAIYGYHRSDLNNVLFIRYEIINNNQTDFSEMYAALWTDTDLFTADNATGYDSLRELSYTYSLPDTTKNFVTGFTFLQTPEINGNPIGATAHRIFRKHSGGGPYQLGEFGEYGLNNPEQIIYVLKGLSNEGYPMINPITNRETKFAFTGDPISNTGWIDSYRYLDTRSFLSSGPFPLKSISNQILTVVWIISSGNTVEQALNSLKSKVDQVRSEPELWNF